MKLEKQTIWKKSETKNDLARQISMIDHGEALGDAIEHLEVDGND